MERTLFQKGFIVYALALVFLVMLGTSSALALSTVTDPSEDNEDPAIAANSSNGQYLITSWNDEDNDLEARRVSATGTPLGGVINIDTSVLLGSNRISAVAYNSTDNEYLVVWVDLGVIKAQRINGDSGALISATTIYTGNRLNFRPDVAYNSADNTYLVAWVNFRLRSPGPKFKGCTVSADLLTLGPVQDYASTAGLINEEIAVAYNSTDNEFLVVFETERLLGSVPDIQAIYADSSGVPQGTVFIVDSASSDSADDPRVAYCPTNNRYFVVWEDNQPGDPPGKQILLRMVGASGGPIGSNIEITPDGEGIDDRDDPDIAYCPAGEVFLVVFENNDEYSVEGQYVFADGTLDGDIFTIAPAPAEPDQRDDPRLAFNSYNVDFLVAFENEDGDDFIEAETAVCRVKPIVPTLDQWGMMIFTALLLLGGLYWLRRHREV